jgi:hypothetical protein
MKWYSYYDDVLNQKVYWFGDYREGTHPEHKSIMIFSNKERECKGSDRMLTRHTISLTYGPYGETGMQKDLPFGTKISDAKRVALDYARLANEKDNANYVLGIPS